MVDVYGAGEANGPVLCETKITSNFKYLQVHL